MPFFDLHNAWHWLVAASALFYAGSLLGIAWGLVRLKVTQVAEQPFVSVVVAARNEERHLPGLLAALLAQEYPAYEVIVVNDRSTDRTAEILAEAQKQDPRLKRVDVEATSDDLSPKQNALTLGIAASRGGILCLTDADSVPGPRWLASTVACFAPDVGSAAGYSPFSSAFLPRRRSLAQRIFDAFVDYEEFRKAARSAAGAAFGKAWGCTGRNFAFRRTAFDAVGGYLGIPRSLSGDDTLLLQQIGKRTPWRFAYLVSPENFVPTAPPENLAEFKAQRARHASGLQHFPRTMQLFFLLLLGSNWVLTGGMGAALLGWGSSSLALAAFGAKCAAETAVFLSAAPRFRVWGFLPTFLLMELACLFYYTALAGLAIFKGRVEWKP
ncbi:MAG: glycosyltransferase [Terriglobales bacterium]